MISYYDFETSIKIYTNNTGQQDNIDDSSKKGSPPRMPIDFCLFNFTETDKSDYKKIIATYYGKSVNDFNASDLETIISTASQFSLSNFMMKILTGKGFTDYLPLPLNLSEKKNVQNGLNMTTDCESEIINDGALPVPVNFGSQPPPPNTMTKWVNAVLDTLTYVDGTIKMGFSTHSETEKSKLRINATNQLHQFGITDTDQINNLLNYFLPISTNCLDNTNTDTTAVNGVNTRTVINDRSVKTFKTGNTSRKILQFIEVDNDPSTGGNVSGQKIHQMPTNDLAGTDSVVES